MAICCPQQQKMTDVLFSDLPLSEEIQKAVAEMGFQNASPIQAEAIPYLLQGMDIIGQAQTGTGKTAAFGIPLIEKIVPSEKSVQAIILCPTRELAVQVCEEIKKLASFKKGIFVTAVYGGDSIDRQIRALKAGTNIVVGTPGRVIDHIERRTLKLENVQTVVLDEADEMLDMGFREDIENILTNVPEERQTVLFSATMSKEIMSLTKRFQKDAKVVKVTRNEVTNSNIEQMYFDVKVGAKMEVMTRLIDFYDLKLSLIFCNQKRKVDEVVEELQAKGYSAEGLHGDMRQQSRTTTMARFRNGQVNFLVATDVAARGIDVENVDAVINFDVPLDSEYYVHRIGRTGRAGKLGRAISLSSGSERYKLRDVSNYTKVQITKGSIPTAQDILNVRKTKFAEKVIEASKEDLTFYQDIAQLLEKSELTTEQLVSTLVKMNFGTLSNNFSNQDLDGEADRANRNRSRERNDERPSGDRYGRERGRDGGRDGGRSGAREFTSERRPFGADRERRPVAGGTSEPRRYEDRGADRGPRIDRGGSEYKRGKEAGMIRLAINIGRDDKISPSNIVGAIAGESGIAGSALGQIDIFDQHTFVDVPQAMANTVLNRMIGAKIKGRKVTIEIAK
jgi:ATP-dependent RNA helicase DeaD